MTAPSSPSLFVVARRELVRTGRRWQTWALRAAFLTALFGLVVMIWSEEVPLLVETNRVALGKAGGLLFRAFVALQTVALVAITPVLVANAVIEERDGKTLELLALTRLSPGKILLGKVLSRVVMLELVVLGGLPLLALCSSLGGFGPLDLLNVFVQSTTIIVSLSAVAAFLGLYSDGPFRPAVQTWFWTLGAWWVAGAPHALMRLDAGGFATVSPTVALYKAHGWQMLGPPIAQLPVAAAVLAFAAAGLRAMLAGADDARDGFGSLGGEFDGLNKVRKSLAWTTAAIFGWAPFVVFQKPLGEFFAPLGLLSLPWTSLFLWLGTGLYLLAVRWSLLRRQAKARRVPKKKWQTLTQEWDQGEPKPPETWTPLGGARPQKPRVAVPRPAPGASQASSEADAWASEPEVAPADAPRTRPVGAQVASLSGRPARQSERLTRSRRWFFGKEVWSNPILWRETMTSAYGGLATSVVRLYLVFGAFGFMLLLLGGLGESFVSIPVGLCALVFSMAAALLTASASIAGELKHDTLGLLLSARMSAARVLWSKALATAAYVGPAWAAGVLLLLLGLGSGKSEFGRGPELLIHWGVFSAWTAVALAAITVSSHAIGLRVRSASRVWIWTVVWMGWNLIGPLILLILLEGADVAEFVVGVWNPLFSEDTWDGDDLPWTMMASTLVWAGVTVGLFWANARRLRRWG